MVPAGIGPATEKVYGDVAWFFRASAGDPFVEWREPYSFDGPRCMAGTRHLGTVQLPASVTVADVTRPDTFNNTFSILHADGRVLTEGNVFARCQVGGPMYGHHAPGDGTAGVAEYDIYGSGQTGGHGGSGLSGLGGTIRVRELLAGTPPISHVLKVEIYARKYLSPDSRDGPGYFVWPAIRADNYASPTTYVGPNPRLKMGSLLALPSSTNCSAMSLVTPAAIKLCNALREYGAYVVDDSDWDAHSFVVESDVKSEFQNIYGYPFDSYTGQFRTDVNRLFVALHVVTNNTPSTVGGGVANRMRERAACIVN